MEHATGFVLPNSGHNRDDEGSKFGMWLFLFTEVLLFGGLFIVYMVYRMLNAEDFLEASYKLNITLGTINTVVLLISSMTIAMAITAIQKDDRKKSLMLLYITIALSLVFMVIKLFEWSAKLKAGIFPGMEAYTALSPGQSLYFFLYYFMTGLHALHVIIGAVLIGVVIDRTNRNLITSNNYIFTENVGLYWHLVDLIWIFLFPLMYLIH